MTHEADLLELALAKLRELHEAFDMNDVARAFNLGDDSLDERLADAMFPGTDSIPACNAGANRPTE